MERGGRGKVKEKGSEERGRGGCDLSLWREGQGSEL